MLAAYLMQTEAMSFDDVEAFIVSKRPLVKLEARHRKVLEAWIGSEGMPAGGDPEPDVETDRSDGQP